MVSSTAKKLNVLKQMKHNKSPGEDGLSKGFFVKFADILLDDLVEMFNNILFQEIMPESLRNVIISFPLKKMITGY